MKTTQILSCLAVAAATKTSLLKPSPLRGSPMKSDNNGLDLPSLDGSPMKPGNSLYLPSLDGSPMESGGSLDLSALYKLLSTGSLSWNLVSNASPNRMDNSLNVAFPNFGSEYWGTAFGDTTTFTVKGAFPKDARYASLTVYDTEGLIMDSGVNFQEAGYEAGKYFEKTFQCIGPCLILNRIYRPADELNTLKSTSFDIVVDAKKMWQAPRWIAKLVGKTLQPIVQKKLGGTLAANDAAMPDDAAMMVPPSSVLPGLFPNANAKYMVTKLAPSTECLRFHGTTPSLDDMRNGTAFYGFMGVDMRTTATVASVDYSQMGGWGKDYDLFVCKQENDAAVYGFTGASDQHVMTLKVAGRGSMEESEYGVVLRIINTGCNGVGCGGLWDPTLVSHDPADEGMIDAAQCHQALGASYPMLQ